MLGGGHDESREDEKLEDPKVYRRRAIEGLENSELINKLVRGEKQVVDSAGRLQKYGFYADDLVGKAGFLGQDNQVKISLLMKSKHEAIELRKKLENEREMVRRLMKKIEANEMETNPHITVENELQPPRFSKPLNQFKEVKGKEKRASKENNLYRNTTKSKSSVTLARVTEWFSRCRNILKGLMKHKNGHVFNCPVDPVALNLYDYFNIIKSPMDLGTVRDKLTKGLYRTPIEFAEDVRLTFRNALTYNPKGDYVYAFAEQLSVIFETKFAGIEAGFKHEFPDGVPMAKSHFANSNDAKRNLNRGVIRMPKPKAKDPYKREMTYDEKQKLSLNLQSLPAEKLEAVVKIIRKKNLSVGQIDDEIEVDIDDLDTETLWELDRFITCYKKKLSKERRKGETIIPNTEENTHEKITTTAVPEIEKGSSTGQQKVIPPLVEAEKPEESDKQEFLSR